MDIITSKAAVVAQKAGLDPAAFDIGSIIQIILQLLQGFKLCGGGATPPPTKIRRALVVRRRAVRRTVEANIDNPALWQPVEQGVHDTATSSTDADLTGMYQEANAQNGGAVQQAT